MKRWMNVMALAGLLATGAAAQAQLLQNGSFEVGPLTSNPPGFANLGGGNTSITGWTVTGASIDFVEAYWTAANGLRSLDLSGQNAGGIEQAFSTVPGRVYRVDFALAGNPSGGAAIKNLQVQATLNPASAYTFDTTGHSTGAMGWVTRSYTFTATGASTTLSFTSLDTGPYGPALDNVVVTDITPRAAAAVPTLSQWALLVLAGLVGLVALGRFRVRSRA